MSARAHRDLMALFQGMSDPTRIRILNLLSLGEVCVGDLAVCLKMFQPTVSRHLAYLKRAKLVVARRQGRLVYYGRIRHGHPASADVLGGLHKWMIEHPDLRDERAKLQRAQKRRAARKRRRHNS